MQAVTPHRPESTWFEADPTAAAEAALAGAAPRREDRPGGTISTMADGEEHDSERDQSELYQELRKRAAYLMRSQPKDHTLQATALVNEFFLKVHGQPGPKESDRARFLALASHVMRNLLVDHARGRNRRKRTPDGERVYLDEAVVSYEERALDLVALDEALEELAEFDPDMARAVEMRFFGGLSVEETAEALEFSKRTFERRWQAVRAWLRSRIG
ncbi:MAG TPA: sigma-70 family RNA polymerase sigma factor [Planctomycetes bacterium]|nr:sigma-70 family RNA polymerase sigma factor [Planctomycetota bacterium]